jgi:hypothetical protein
MYSTQKSKEETIYKYILEEKIRDFKIISDLFNLKSITKISSLLSSTNFNNLEIEINKKDFYSHQKLVGYIPFIYKKRKIKIRVTEL